MALLHRVLRRLLYDPFREERRKEFDRHLRRYATTDDLDVVKSSLDVPVSLHREFEVWKASNPVPTHPRVSVCVATYNRSDMLMTRCIPSILAQDYDNIEVIVVGDCCTDNTGERLTALRDPRVTWTNLPERGAYPLDPTRRWMVAGTVPRNYAMDVAAGDFITYLDDDDEYVPHRISTLVALASDCNADFVWHPFHYEKQNSGGWSINSANEIRYGNVTTSSIFYRAWFRVIRWDAYSDRLKEGCDWTLCRRISAVGGVSIRCPEPLLRHYAERSRAT